MVGLFLKVLLIFIKGKLLFWIMDFCVKCGKKEVYDEGLCRDCYKQVYNPLVKKKKKKAKKELAKHPLYYEAILQLRNPDKHVLELVDDGIDKKGIGVAKVDKVRGGYDFYLADQKFAQQIGKQLRTKYGGILKVTAKLYSVSHQTSKEIYRVTVLYRRPPFKVGEVVEIKGDKIKIKSLGKEVIGVMENGRKIKYSFKDLERMNVI